MKKYIIEVSLLVKRLFASLPAPFETRYINENNIPVLHLFGKSGGQELDITIKTNEKI